MTDFEPEPEDSTPLSHDDFVGLKPSWIANRGDLNQAEAQNINDAAQRYLSKRLNLNEILDDLFIRNLHSRMFENVWDWAGQYRKVETSIGIDPREISVSVVNLVRDASIWLNVTSADEIDKAVCEVHHKLVAIHPFRNGNGRLCRLYADLILVNLRRPAFTWGAGSSSQSDLVRRAYISALKNADAGNYEPLVEFVRS